MANLSTILLGLGAAALYLFSEKKEYKAADGTVFSTQEELDAYNLLTSSETSSGEAGKQEDEAAVAQAKAELAKAESVYADKVTISDSTILLLDNNNNKILQTAHVYVLVKLRNWSSIPVLVTPTDVAATILHSSNQSAFSFVEQNEQILIPAHTETKWITLTSNYSSIFPKRELYSDIETYMPQKSNFFFPAHILIKYSVSIPNQDTVLAKDVLYEANTECYWLSYADKTPFMDVLPQYDVFNKYDYNVVNVSPNVLPKYQAYLDILRDNVRKVQSNIPKYRGFPVRYILKANNEDEIRRKITYWTYKFTDPKQNTGKWIQTGTIYLPYMGIVFNQDGVVAYE